MHSVDAAVLGGRSRRQAQRGSDLHTGQCSPEARGLINTPVHRPGLAQGRPHASPGSGKDG